jgi:uncharacterized protein (DUF433 family)
VVIRNNQRVFAEVVEQYLRRVNFAADDYAQVIHLPQYCVADVTLDPDHAFGRPRFTRSGARLDDVVELFLAGEPVDVVTAEVGLSRDEWRALFVPLREQQPKFFLDRSLGRIALPFCLRAGGWHLVTLAEHYARPPTSRSLMSSGSVTLPRMDGRS